MVRVLLTATAFVSAVIHSAFNAPTPISEPKLLQLLAKRFADPNPDLVTQSGSETDHTIVKTIENSQGIEKQPEVEDIVRQKRFSLEGSKWSKSDFKYKILSYPIGLEKSLVLQVIQKAFDEWSKYTSLKFTPASEPDGADFKIEFVEADHGDERNFDGPEGFLAHSFYPQYGGQIHFDKAETWTVGSSEGTNLFQIAVHEIGHALGLEHSNEESSAMWPHYSRYIPDFHLSQDDIRAIQVLYGPKSNTISNTEEILCDGKGPDTVLSTRDGTYVFKGIYYWTLGDKTSSKPELKLITDTWTAIPGDIDAAFTDKKGRIYFFKGNQYWRYKGKYLDGNYPRKISRAFAGIPDDIDAVFGKFEGKQKLYFFKGKYYYQFVPSGKPKVASIYPRLIEKRWKGLPNKIDAVIRKNDGHIYFFSGNYNYIFADDLSNTDTSSPTNLKSKIQWFGCKDASQTNQMKKSDIPISNDL